MTTRKCSVCNLYYPDIIWSHQVGHCPFCGAPICRSTVYQHLTAEEKQAYREVNAEKQVETKVIERQPEKVRRKYTRRKPKGAYCHDKVYQKWVMNSEVQKVRNAIEHDENNYIPTTNAIVQQTGMTLNTVRATLHSMRVKGEVTSKKSGRKKYIHRLVERD